MLTQKFIKKALKLRAQVGELTGSVPRDHLPASYYTQKNFEHLKRSSLEEKAKELLRWKITKKGKAPNPFEDIHERYQLIKYMEKRGYIIKKGRTPKSLDYGWTPEGRKWALGR